MLSLMRTTLDIDDDVLLAAKELGSVHGQTAGQVVSSLLRKALAAPRTVRVRNGVPLVPKRPGTSEGRTLAHVNRLRD